MCKGSSGGGTNTVVQNSQPPPQVLQQYQNVQNQANQTAQQPYQWYNGSLVAGLSPDQNSAISSTSNLAGALENPANTYGQYQPFANTASGVLGSSLGDLQALSNPNNTYGQAVPFLNASSALTMAGSQPIGAGQINNYMNPYLQQVGQTTSAEMNQNNAIQQQQLLGNAAASGALGGNRVGLAQSSLANQQDLAENATLANINAQGFNTALGAAQTTAGQQLQGGFLMGQTGQLAENAALEGLSAPISAAGQLGGAYQNLGASNEANSIGALQAGLGGAGAQFQTGTAEQQQQQNELNAQYGQWLGSVQYPFQNTQFLSNIATGLGSNEGGTSSTAYPSPAVGSQVLGGLAGTAGLLGGLSEAGMFGAGGLGGLLGITGSGAAAGAGASALGAVGGGLALLKDGGRVGRDAGGEATAAMITPQAVQPQDEFGNTKGASYLSVPSQITHGRGLPNAPEGGTQAPGQAQQQIAGFSSMPDLAKYIGKEVNEKPAGFADGGTPDQIPSPMSEQVLDYQMIGQLAPGAQVRKIEYQPPQGIYHRGGQVAGFAAGGVPQGMQGVSGMPLIGQQAGLSLPGAGSYQPAAGGVGGPAPQVHALPVSPAATIAAPQVSGLSIPSVGSGAQFAPVSYPNGTQSGVISGLSGLPTDYASAIRGGAGTSGSQPGSGNSSASDAPTPDQLQSMISDALTKQQADQENQYAISGFPGSNVNGGNKRGGRIKRADGGDTPDAAPDETGKGVPPNKPKATDIQPPSSPLGAGVPGFGPVVDANGVPDIGSDAGLKPVMSGGRPDTGAPAAPGFASFPTTSSPQTPPAAPQLPVAVRDNNPMGLTYAPGQPGLNPQQPQDGRWGNYLTTMDNVAASTQQLLRYQDRGLNTVQSIIGTWSPAGENGAANTQKYINTIAGALGVKPDQQINLSDPDTMARLTSAIWQHESGAPADPRAIQGGVQAGFQIAARDRGTQYAQAGMSDVPTEGGGQQAGIASIPGTPQWFAQTQPQVFGATGQARQPVQHVGVPETSSIERLGESPWMALAKAGFGMMGGSSPFAGVNIGRGAQAGVDYLQNEGQLQRQRQALQLGAQQKNVENLLAQREQALRGAQVATQFGANGTGSFQAIPTIQQGQITAGAVPGVVNPITGTTSAPVTSQPAAPPPAADPMVRTSFGDVLPLSAAIAKENQVANVGGPPGDAARQWLGNLNAEKGNNRLTLSDGTVVPYPGAIPTNMHVAGAQQQMQSANEQVAQFQKDAAGAQNVEQNVVEMMDAAEKAAPNPGAGLDQGVARAAINMAHQLGLPVGDNLTEYQSNADLVHKLNVQLASQATQVTGDRAYAALAAFAGATPSMNLSSKASFDMLGRSLAQFAQLRLDLADFAQKNAISYATQNPNSPGGWMQDFIASHPPQMYASRVQPVGLKTNAKGQPLQPAGGLKAGYDYTMNGITGQWDGQKFVPIDQLGNGSAQ